MARARVWSGRVAPSRLGLDSGQARGRWYILSGMQTHRRTRSSQVKPGYRGTTGRRGQEEACGRRGEGQQGAAEPAEETKAPWTRRARCARTASCAASCATPAASSPARSSPRACCCPEGALPARGRRRPPARSARAAAPRARRARHLPGARQARLSGGARPRVQEATRAHCRRQKSCRMEWQPRWLRA